MSLSEEKKAEIKKKVERISTLLDNTSSVSEALTLKYKQEVEKNKRLSESEQEKNKRIADLEKDKEDLAKQVEEVKNQTPQVPASASKEEAQKIKEALEKEQEEKLKALEAKQKEVEEKLAEERKQLTEKNELAKRELDEAKKELQNKETELKKALSDLKEQTAKKSSVTDPLVAALQENVEKMASIISEAALKPKQYPSVVDEKKLGLDPELLSKAQAVGSPLFEQVQGIQKAFESIKQAAQHVGEKARVMEAGTEKLTEERNLLAEKNEQAQRELETAQHELQNKDAALNDLRQQVEERSRITDPLVASLQDNVEKMASIISEAALMPKRFQSVLDEKKLGLDPEILSKARSAGSPLAEQAEGIQKAFDSIRQAAHVGEKAKDMEDGAEKLEKKYKHFDSLEDSDGSKAYTLIEKIENSKVDINSRFYGSSFGEVKMPGMPSPLKAGATSEEKDQEPVKEEDEETSKEEPKEDPVAEDKPEEPEPEEAEEEAPVENFNPYQVAAEDDLFAEEKPEPEKPPEKKPEKKVDKKPKPEEKKEEKGRDKIEINLRDDDYEKYGKNLKLTYLFDNMPNNLTYSKYKKALRNACRITLLGNLEDGLNLFNELKKQKLPAEYLEMIDKNIRDVKYYLRGKFRSAEADLE
jgi:myosin heavy subunit